MNKAQYEVLITPLWNYLVIRDELRQSDVIFVFGSFNEKVALKAAKLYTESWAPIVLVSGKGKFGYASDKVEAHYLQSYLEQKGVSPSSILTEEKSTNTLENVLWGMQKLDENGVKVKKVILVAKPPHMRRCKATFEKHYSQIKTLCAPPEGSIWDLMDRPPKEFAERLITEIERIRIYGEKGDIVIQSIPSEIEAGVNKLRDFLDTQDEF